MNPVRRWNVSVPLFGPDVVVSPRTETSVGLSATLVMFPMPYVIVGAEPRTSLFECPDDALLETCRCEMAHDFHLDLSTSIPKVALVSPDLTGATHLRFRSRLGLDQGWHPGAPGSGLLAVGAALLKTESVPSSMSGSQGPAWLIGTPAGQRTVRFVCCPDGSAGLRVDVGVTIARTP